MASSYTNIDLSQLPLPAVVEQIDFDTVLGQMLADLVARDPAFTALVPSDPAYKVLEVCAFREVVLRQRVNEAAQATMLAYATGADLDHRGATYNVERLLLEAGNAVVSDAFIASRLEQGGRVYGTLPRGMNVEALVARSTPHRV